MSMYILRIEKLYICVWRNISINLLQQPKGYWSLDGMQEHLSAFTIMKSNFLGKRPLPYSDELGYRRCKRILSVYQEKTQR